MQHYRAYIMGWDDHVLSSVDLFCRDDEAAKKRARQLADGHDVELWQLDRKISVFLSETKMAKFYFHFQRADNLVKDSEGTECPGLAEAKALALDSARELIAEDVKRGAPATLLAVLIEDDNGKQLAELKAKDALPETLK
jgi:hypothetical protein